MGRVVMRMWKQVGALVVTLGLALPVDAEVIDFERPSLLDAPNSWGAEVTDQYSDLGVTFAHTIALISGLGLNETDFPPYSGTNVASDLDAPIDTYFADPVKFVSGWFTYATRLLLAALDGGGNTIAEVLTLPTPNLGSNELIELSVAGGFRHLQIAGDPAGGSFTLDDLTFSREVPVNGVPEPGTLLLVVVAGVVGLTRRRGLAAG